MTARRIRVLAAGFAAVPGADALSASLLSMIEALRGDLDVVTIKTEDLPHIKRIGDARMFRVPIGAPSRAHRRELYTRAVGRQIESESYDVVHVLDPWAGVAAADRKKRGYRLVYELSSFPAPDAEEEDLWIEADEYTLEAADRILAPTDAAAQILAQRGYAERVEVVHPGVDVHAFDLTDAPRGGVPRLLYLGDFSRRRDLATAVAAIARVQALRGIEVLFAGEANSSERERVREMVAASGLDQVVHVRGEPSPRTIPSIIAACDICLVPAADHRIAGRSQLPQPLLEHMACCRPVVAADVPGISELISDDVEGLLYPPGDPGALADAVLELLRDPVLRERVAQAGYRRAHDELTIGARRRRLRTVYEAIAPGSQMIDPWNDPFEENTGILELTPSALHALELEGDDLDLESEETQSPPSTQKMRTVPPEAPPLETPPPTDTQPAVMLPDTDPGRR